MAENKNIQAWVGAAGALMVREEIKGVTQTMDSDEERFYGGKFFIGETIRESAGKAIADSMGWEFVEKRP